MWGDTDEGVCEAVNETNHFLEGVLAKVAPSNSELMTFL
jgi:hypothetical protein